MPGVGLGRFGRHVADRKARRSPAMAGRRRDRRAAGHRRVARRPGRLGRGRPRAARRRSVVDRPCCDPRQHATRTDLGRWPQPDPSGGRRLAGDHTLPVGRRGAAARPQLGRDGGGRATGIQRPPARRRLPVAGGRRPPRRPLGPPRGLHPPPPGHGADGGGPAARPPGRRGGDGGARPHALGRSAARDNRSPPVTGNRGSSTSRPCGPDPSAPIYSAGAAPRW